MVPVTAERGDLVEEGRPLFVQIAEEIEASVLDGSLAEGERAPSTNELAAFHRINQRRQPKASTFWWTGKYSSNAADSACSSRKAPPKGCGQSGS